MLVMRSCFFLCSTEAVSFVVLPCILSQQMPHVNWSCDLHDIMLTLVLKIEDKKTMHPGTMMLYWIINSRTMIFYLISCGVSLFATHFIGRRTRSQRGRRD